MHFLTPFNVASVGDIKQLDNMLAEILSSNYSSQVPQLFINFCYLNEGLKFGMQRLIDVMARNLAGGSDVEQQADSTDRDTENKDKALLNRRGYLLLGASSVATVLGAGSSLIPVSSAQETSNSFQTDFSEYV